MAKTARSTSASRLKSNERRPIQSVVRSVLRPKPSEDAKLDADKARRLRQIIRDHFGGSIVLFARHALDGRQLSLLETTELLELVRRSRARRATSRRRA